MRKGDRGTKKTNKKQKKKEKKKSSTLVFVVEELDDVTLFDRFFVGAGEGDLFPPSFPSPFGKSVFW